MDSRSVLEGRRHAVCEVCEVVREEVLDFGALTGILGRPDDLKNERTKRRGECGWISRLIPHPALRQSELGGTDHPRRAGHGPAICAEFGMRTSHLEDAAI